MIKKDVIITVFANSTQAPCNKWAQEFFSEEPIVLTVPGGGGNDFRAKAINWTRSGDTFAAALKELRPDLKDVEVGRRGLVTFSAGWAFADELLKSATEKDRLDAYLLLDGCHTNVLAQWISFASRAANLDAFMVMAHSCIKPPFISTTITNSEIFRRAAASNSADMAKPEVESDIPDYVLNAVITDPITISLGASPGLPGVSKKWPKDVLMNSENRGGLTRLQYSGNDRPDHVYIAWYVAKRLWKWLGEEWSE